MTPEEWFKKHHIRFERMSLERYIERNTGQGKLWAHDKKIVPFRLINRRGESIETYTGVGHNSTDQASFKKDPDHFCMNIFCEYYSYYFDSLYHLSQDDRAFWRKYHVATVAERKAMRPGMRKRLPNMDSEYADELLTFLKYFGFEAAADLETIETDEQIRERERERERNWVKIE